MAQAAAALLNVKTTPLHAEHVALGARMVPFAGYDMPVQYSKGILTEHIWTRAHAGLFDVSHMGQAFLVGPDHATTAAALEKLIPSDVLGLKPGQQRYSVLLNNEGGILDDLMVTRPVDPLLDGHLFLVVNAGCKDADFAHLNANLPADVRLNVLNDRALIALQGPEAADVLARHTQEAGLLGFMQTASIKINGIPVYVSRSGYTGEDGFEISAPADAAVAVWRALLEHPEVEAIGLGARDSLRLEAGLCLYGHDIDTATNPVDADIAWVIQKRRRQEGGFPGYDVIKNALENGPSRRRVGLMPEGRAPAREGCAIADPNGRIVGHVTSGGFGPTVNGPIAMGYVEAEFAAMDTPVQVIVRGEARPARVVSLPFVPHRYKR